jgi:glycosyltransferase XagB
MKNIKKYLADIIINHDMSISNEDKIALKSGGNLCVFDFLNSKSTIDNELIIRLLKKNRNIKHINIDTLNIRAVIYQNLNEYFLRGYFKFKNQDGLECIAINNINCFKKWIELKTHKIFLIEKDDFIEILERDFAPANTDWAINYLKDLSPNSSAKNIMYAKALTGFFTLFAGLLCLFVNLFGIINNLAFLVQNIFKAILFKRSIVADEESGLVTLMDDLPIYSVLIPLYKEEFKVAAILKAMKNLNYPKSKLDIKLIIEDDDVLTKRTIAIQNLPDYVQVIKVPFSLPRTKPKALNYAIPFIKGEYVTIYDAEDIPDQNQLLKTIYAFSTLPENYACIQAKLNFYNKNENLLTRFFSLEYSIWFEYLLRGLSLLNLPITLGGTSNHFKLDKLKEVGYWDPYNVTEDADLGIRLYLKGYKVHLINSTTLEEAPTDVPTWIAQRSRWIKGFLQTLFVFIKMKKDYKRFGILKISTVYIFVGLSTYSFFCLPWLFIIFLLDLNYLILYLFIINSVLYFSYMYTVAYLVIKKEKSLIRELTPMNWLTLISWPAYFILHTIACYRAVLETFVSPFKWNKTPHGKAKHNLNQDL